ncbi:MAG: 50S ribosomal protein L9 [Anaerolineae bacterium]
MEVLLIKDVPGIGKAGQTKKVADGYARNYLLARHFAVVASATALKQAEKLQQASIKREAETRDDARRLADMLAQVRLSFRVKAGENDRLFGAITAGDIAEALQSEHQITIDKRKIELEQPLKELGQHRVPIKLHPEVSAAVNVLVERE